MLDVRDKKVLVVGMARSGVAAARLLVQNAALPVLCDQKPEDAFGGALDDLRALPCVWRLGEDGTDALDGVSLVVVSPAVPLSAPVMLAAAARGVPVIGELELASQLAKDDNPLVAVTGTNGKTTTVSLLGAMYREAGRVAHVAGNVGYPLSAAALLAKPSDTLIAEVSSFQLETIRDFHPRVAAVLNVTEDHLNRHGTMDAYAALKRRIFINQTERDIAVLNRDDAFCRDMAQGLDAQIAWFSKEPGVTQGACVEDGRVILRWGGEERAVMEAREISIPGPHNLENALAAAMVAFVGGVPAPVIRHALRTFAGVEHRIEFVREAGGARYYNDSKGTNADATIKAVQSMRAPTVLIAGGYDKHVSFDALAACIKASGLIARVLLIGQTARQIADALKNAGFADVGFCDTLEDAVREAARLSEPGGNVLFSPACASFDMFADYEARGHAFKELVHHL